MEDTDIIELFIRRNEMAIDMTAEKYGRLCISLSRRILENEQDAEECVSDAYLALWNTIPPQRPRSLCAYLCGITRNISIKRYHSSIYRQYNRQYEISLDELSECLPGPDNVEELTEGKELTLCINQFLEGIKSFDRIIFVQRYWFCMNVNEISEMTGESTNYINVHLHRIRKRLKKHLVKEEYL